MRFVLWIALGLGFLGCNSTDIKPETPLTPPAPTWNSPVNSVTVMTFSVQRETTLEQLGDSIRAGRNGIGPDILILGEVKSKAFLRRLVDEELKGLGYTSIILVEGKRSHRPHVAIIVKLKTVGKPKLHENQKILEAAIKMPDGRIVKVFAVHLPAPPKPSDLRVEAMKFLNSLKKRLPQGQLAIAAGDFGITNEEDAQSRVIERFADQEWLVAHKLGCKDCQGVILMSKEFYDGGLDWKVLRASVRSVNGASAVDFE